MATSVHCIENSNTLELVIMELSSDQHYQKLKMEIYHELAKFCTLFFFIAVKCFRMGNVHMCDVYSSSLQLKVFIMYVFILIAVEYFHVINICAFLIAVNCFDILRTFRHWKGKFSHYKYARVLNRSDFFFQIINIYIFHQYCCKLLSSSLHTFCDTFLRILKNESMH